MHQSSKIGWTALPGELRDTILELLKISLQGAKAASYASVCRAWNRFFEPYIFRRLKLSANRIREFEDFITEHRRPFVQSIWFRFERYIEPPKAYSRIAFQHLVDVNQYPNAVSQLFQSLSQWKERDEGQPGITLELSAFSAIDPDFSFQDFVPEGLEDVDITKDFDVLKTIYDSFPLTYAYKRTYKEKSRQNELKHCYYPPDMDDLPGVPFPTVNLITTLTVRRQMHSNFFATYLHHIVRALPMLECLTYEPSTLSFISGNFDYSPDTHYMESMDNTIFLLPSSIRHFQVFLDDISLYDFTQRVPEYYGPDIAVYGPHIAREVLDCSRSKEIETLSMSFIIDAYDFFADFQIPEITQPPDMLTWTKLTSLVLTSSRITLGDAPTKLLLAGARAAQYMPRLEVMELYNVDPEGGGIFTYIHDKEGSHIYWKSIWKWEFPPEVITEWRTAAATHGTYCFDYDSDFIDVYDLGWPGRILSLLHTRTMVVHPFTYCNMMDGYNFM